MAVGTFSVVDYVIFALMLAISAGIGIFYGCFGNKNATARDMLIANRQMGVFPTAMSLLASFMSGITILGNPAEAYNYGTMYIWCAVTYTLITIATAHVFMPLFHNLGITSTYEYLEKRFNKYVKLMASCIFITQMTIYMSLVLYAPALALSAVTDINIWILVVSIGVVCTFYTTIGGMKAVMWTDVFQICMMMVGLLASLIKGVMDNGGIKSIVEANWKRDRIELFEFNPNPTTRHTVWGLVIGFFFQWLSIYGVNQSQVQRYLSVSSVKKARSALYWNLFGLIIILVLTLSVGLVIFAKYSNCDPMSAGLIGLNEELYPLFVMETLKDTSGLPGLFLACLFSAALSTISSGLNSLSAVVLEDIIKGFIVKNLSEKREALLSKLLCVGFGIVCLVLTFLAQYLGGLLQAALSLFGVIGGPLLGLFALGIFIPFANSKGAIVGTCTGLLFTIWIFVGFNVYGIKYPKKSMSISGCNATIEGFNKTLANVTLPERHGLEAFHSISYTWYGFLAVVVVVTVGMIVSLITGKSEPGDVDTTLMIPVFTRLCPCLPKKFHMCCECGYTYRRKSVDSDSVKEDRDFIERMMEKTQSKEIADPDDDIRLKIATLSRSNSAFVESNQAVTKL